MCTDVTSSYRLERRVIILSLDMFPRRKLESSCSYAISRCRFEKRMITYFLDIFSKKEAYIFMCCYSRGVSGFISRKGEKCVIRVLVSTTMFSLHEVSHRDRN